MKFVANKCHILKVKIHEIQYRLGLCPRSRWRSLHHSPTTPSWIHVASLL